MAAYNKTLVFYAAVRDFHVYRDVWSPQENEELECFHEQQNLFDMFAIKTCRKSNRETVGHLPREISRPTKFLIDSTIIKYQFQKVSIISGGFRNPLYCKDKSTGKCQGTHVNSAL